MSTTVVVPVICVIDTDDKEIAKKMAQSLLGVRKYDAELAAYAKEHNDNSTN